MIMNLRIRLLLQPLEILPNKPSTSKQMPLQMGSKSQQIKLPNFQLFLIGPQQQNIKISSTLQQTSSHTWAYTICKWFQIETNFTITPILQIIIFLTNLQQQIQTWNSKLQEISSNSNINSMYVVVGWRCKIQGETCLTPLFGWKIKFHPPFFSFVKVGLYFFTFKPKFT